MPKPQSHMAKCARECQRRREPKYVHRRREIECVAWLSGKVFPRSGDLLAFKSLDDMLQEGRRT